ncbi:hypothetical protein NEUTE1DRAFT_95348 [Neurospora tetrasperma FGSC 2508]|uniref:Uncharacterized protein n=1 Tax=Neurospora tetrasperma (strain FGSC 2508 / ATCC MYA-4615 / P0657) TaxID=510951 RepID=F8MQP6_NEUT8|nr:uncharacterized protein NEUTE1DRAFT_95348 [Neurospora tetrasperma FGSC 2508]EGO56676.1 hypothetical protein NEUTE1DRAFT_95348 [Neurospora tetrasperma FGSC 2508]
MLAGGYGPWPLSLSPIDAVESSGVLECRPAAVHHAERELALLVVPDESDRNWVFSIRAVFIEEGWLRYCVGG